MSDAIIEGTPDTIVDGRSDPICDGGAELVNVGTIEGKSTTCSDGFRERISFERIDENDGGSDIGCVGIFVGKLVVGDGLREG